LAAQTIERCVSSNQWLLQGVNPNGEFEAAHGIIKQVMADKELESNKHIPDMVQSIAQNVFISHFIASVSNVINTH
jgi:hypothetical protein